jgi:hypothetical protein
MELPATVQACQELIRELVEENAALRKAGADFGQLAERLNAALQEERRRALEQPAPRAVARSRKPRPLVNEDATERWAASPSGLQALAGTPPPFARHLRTGWPVRRPRTAKWIL